MSHSPEDLISRYADKGLVVDTNLLVLLIIGSFDRSLITRFKRTQKYTVDDFDILVALLDCFPTRSPILTPQIWIETNSLVGQLAEPFRTQCLDTTFRQLVNISSERYLASKELAANQIFTRFGLTDAGIEQLAVENLVVSDDFPLVSYLEKLDRAVINFNHLRNWNEQSR